LLRRDPQLSPLDLAIAPSGNIVVNSEHPFGAANVTTTIREYDRADGHLGKRLVLGTPGYFERAGSPASPGDLSKHQAVVYLQGEGSIWSFRRDSSEAAVKVQNSLKVTAGEGVRAAVLAHAGLTIAWEWMFTPELRSVLSARCYRIGAFHRLICGRCFRPGAPRRRRHGLMLISSDAALTLDRNGGSSRDRADFADRRDERASLRSCLAFGVPVLQVR
jgi:hypothetical protein